MNFRSLQGFSILVIGVVLLACVYSRHGLYDLFKFRSQIELTRKQIAMIEEENRKFKYKLDLLQNPTEALTERNLRMILGWVKPGEIVYFGNKAALMNILLFLISTLLIAQIENSPVHAGSDSNPFQGKSLMECDLAFEASEAKPENQNITNRKNLVENWEGCWKRNANQSLEQRLLKLRKDDPREFALETQIQKTFNRAVEDVCGKDCGEGGTMGAIPSNYCRIQAYKYRTAQVIQMNKGSLSAPLEENFGLLKAIKKEKGKSRETRSFKIFVSQLCLVPKEVWKKGTRPADCEAKALLELDGLQLTDDVCDLS